MVILFVMNSISPSNGALLSVSYSQGKKFIHENPSNLLTQKNI